MIKSRSFIAILFSVVLVIGCGGGGGSSSNPTPPNPDPVSEMKTHNGALAVGDLIDFKYDAVALKKNPFEVPYSYEVLEGLNEGLVGNGHLERVAGTSTFFRTENHNPFLLYEGNLIIGIPENKLGIFVGIPELATEYVVEDIVGVYNFVQCTGKPGTLLSTYKTNFGTFNLIDNGHWELAIAKDISDPQTNATQEGFWKDRGNGIIHILDLQNVKVANVFINPGPKGDTHNKLFVMDICSTEALSGVRLGVKQSVVIPEKIEGRYNCLTVSSYKNVAIGIENNQLYIPDEGVGILQDLQHNQPWDGFVTTIDYMALPTSGGIFFGGTKLDSQKDSIYFSGIEESK